MAALMQRFRQASSLISLQYAGQVVLFKGFCNRSSQEKQKFDVKLLDILVCPLSKKPLRYNAETNELISDEIGVAFSIEQGIPNLVPTDGKLLNTTDPKNEES
ncbi:predicted protein [Nematostella vectensis]|uniref:Protein preY, mitochondrial n=1 Tax=Nematostella vectensis TaxID=45351 RepID=A7S3Z0_NEMVE|nr:predicted protein [Nematostella vectensis]|eukprot:XP_001633634.1 predicted protein [Nematostella vectensis]